MTTIATDGFSMAADGQITAGHLISSRSFVKITRLKDGRIVGCSGIATVQAVFCKWLEAGDPDAPFKHGYNDDEMSFVALVLNPDGSVVSYNHKAQPTPIEAPAAIGSGDDFAVAAMTMGADPRRAVEVAAHHDCYTGGTITVLHRDK